MGDPYQPAWRKSRPPSRAAVRFRATVGVVVLLTLLIGPIWYLAQPAEAVRVSGRVFVRALVLEVPAGGAAPELGIRAHRRVSLEAASLYAKGFEGTITLPDEEIVLAPEADFVLLAEGEGSGVDLATETPLVVRLQPDQDLELTVEAGRVDAGADQPPVPALAYGFRSAGRARGVVRAGSLRLQGAGGLTYADKPVQAVELTAVAGDPPLGFSAAADGVAARLRVAFDTSRQDWGVQELRAAASRATLMGASGRMLLGGRQAVAPTGLEEVELSGRLEVSDVEVVGDRVAVSIRGAAEEVRVEGESVMPTALDRLATRPLWTVGFAVALVVWAALVLPVIRLLLTGSWGSE